MVSTKKPVTFEPPQYFLLLGQYGPEKAIQTFEEIGRIPGRVLKYLLSYHSLDVIDDDTPFEKK